MQGKHLSLCCVLGMPRSTSTPSITPAPICRRCQTLGFAGGSLGKKRKGRSHGLLLLGCRRTPRIRNPRSTILLLKWHDFLSTWEFFKWIHAIQGTYSPKPVARCSTCLCQFSTPASSKPRIQCQAIEYDRETHPTPMA